MGLTPEQTEVAHNAFAIFSGSKGTLNRNELADALRALGFSPAPSQLPGGDSHDVNALISIANSMQAPTDKENDELAAAFRVFDRTGQGIIPADEFANQAKILGEGLTDLEAAELLKYSQDGKLQYKELLAKMVPS